MKTPCINTHAGKAGSIRLLLFMLLLCAIGKNATAQTLYVDAVNGKSRATGTAQDPLASLEVAIQKSNTFSGKEPVHIKIFPGLYSLTDKLTLRTGGDPADTAAYTVEAVYMPDDTAWRPLKMPVIQSISGNNAARQFPHSAGMFVEKSNVTIKGLKFLGNANPGVKYYYPVRRDNNALKGLTVSQCYFVGDISTAPVQSGFWIVGGIDVFVDHCIFYNCKNAFVLRNIDGFSVTHSIVYGAYEAFMWNIGTNMRFVFKNNIVTGGNYLMVHAENAQPAYTFSDSYITGNENYLGVYSKNGMALTPVKTTALKEQNVRKTGSIKLVQIKADGMPRDYFNLDVGSEGSGLKAGVFKTE